METSVEHISDFWSELKTERSGMKLYSKAVNSAIEIKSIYSILGSLLNAFNLRDVYFLSMISKFIRYVIKDHFLSDEIDEKINYIISSENYGYVSFQQGNSLESLEGSIELVSI